MYVVHLYISTFYLYIIAGFILESWIFWSIKCQKRWKLLSLRSNHMWFTLWSPLLSPLSPRLCCCHVVEQHHTPHFAEEWGGGGSRKMRLQAGLDSLWPVIHTSVYGKEERDDDMCLCLLFSPLTNNSMAAHGSSTAPDNQPSSQAGRQSAIVL